MKLIERVKTFPNELYLIKYNYPPSTCNMFINSFPKINHHHQPERWTSYKFPLHDDDDDDDLDVEYLALALFKWSH